ncbi:PREDICTED: F-box protein At5g25290-like [Camelina sativa]|uniref:F-box protein At5g25290-like n=1 Tax=Camelina sativa TaxID=90675 RepID=A0ABM0Y1G4_CAMSA|nr:PREDICTED: F-box protein At5g25290-like [Camelina sativa]
MFFFAEKCRLQQRKETMESGSWSELSMDILRSVFERLSFVDFHRAKMVCANWYLCSKQTLHRQRGSSWLMMLFEESDCVLYNPDEDRVYKRKRDFSGIRFLANSGNWFLALDSGSNLCIVHVFSGGERNRINLPPLDSINKGGHFTLKRIGDGEFKERLASGGLGYSNKSVVDLRGLLWVDEKKEEYTVAWFFDTGSPYIAFCKKGQDHYRTIPTRIDVPREFRGLSDMVLRGDTLYVYTTRRFIRILDFSVPEGFKDVVPDSYILLPFYPASDDENTYDDGAISSHNIAVTTSGEVLLVESIAYNKATSEIPTRIFRLYKTDPNPDPDELIHKLNLSVEVDSLGHEARLLDLGFTVPADPTLGIQPNSIYFTRHDRLRNCKLKPSCPDIFPCICVFNLDTKKLTQFPSLSNLNPKDARWFLPS